MNYRSYLVLLLFTSLGLGSHVLADGLFSGFAAKLHNAKTQVDKDACATLEALEQEELRLLRSPELTTSSPEKGEKSSSMTLKCQELKRNKKILEIQSLRHKILLLEPLCTALKAEEREALRRSCQAGTDEILADAALVQD